MFATSSLVCAQTAPTPLTIPVSQNFGTTTFTTLPSGFAAWNGVSGASVTTQALAEASAPTGNATIATATAATTAGGFFGYAAGGDAKPYIQTSSNTTNGVNQLAMAVNSVGYQNLIVGYSVEMISAQPRTVGVVCQFRAGTSGAWTTVTPTTGLNPYSQAGGTAGLKTTVTATLPPAANNQPVVQVRWAVWRGTESGNSSGLAIDNVTLSADVAPPDLTSPTLVSVSPADGAVNVLPASNLTVTYDESIVPNDGGSIIIKNGASEVETITLPDSRVTISGATATINPAALLSPNTTYTVIFGGQPFKDVAGNSAPVLTDETFWNFTTRAVPDVVINQYYEGTGTFDRYIELKNTTNSAVSLSGYRLTVWSDSSPDSNENWKSSGTGTTDREVIFADLTTVPTIQANSTLLIANIGALAPAYASNSANLKGAEVDEATFFNGDDSVVLYFGVDNVRANVVDAVSIVGTEGIDTSFYRLTNTPAFTFDIGSKITDDLGQAWQQTTVAAVDAATSANPFYLEAYIDPVPPVLDSFSIGNGAATAVTPRVTLNFTSTGGVPTEYQVSESSDFTGAVWTAMPGGAPVIELSSGNGAKTLYFKIRNAFGETTASNDTITRANFTNAGPVIFTQYYEGTSNNKYVEITNISSSPVDLSTWNLVRWGNAEAENWKISNVPSGSSSGVLNLSGILAAGQTVVLSNNQAAIPVPAGSAFISSSIINHTGNDSFGLYEGSVATENLRDALSFTNAGNEGADKSFVRISSGTGFDFTAGTNITGFGTVWQEVTLAVVNAATSNQKEFLGTYLDTALEDYAAWIDGFFEGNMDPNTIGFGADPDFDGIANGIEALIGGNPNAPGVFATTELTKTGNVFTFLYPQDKSVPVGVTAAYEWSTDLANWQGTGESFGGVTMTLADELWDDGDTEVDIYQVIATVTAGTPTTVFVRVLAEN
jgi:hypothetical protein